MNIRPSLLLILCLLHPFALAEPLYRQPEAVVFSCDLPKKTTVAICAGVDPGPDYVEYRIARGKRVEFVHRSDEIAPATKFHRAEVLYANNSALVLWFVNTGTTYRIILPMRGDPSVVETRPGKTVSQQYCTGGWHSVRGNVGHNSKFIIDHGVIDDLGLSRVLGNC